MLKNHDLDSEPRWRHRIHDSIINSENQFFSVGTIKNFSTLNNASSTFTFQIRTSIRRQPHPSRYNGLP